MKIKKFKLLKVNRFVDTALSIYFIQLRLQRVFFSVRCNSTAKIVLFPVCNSRSGRNMSDESDSCFHYIMHRSGPRRYSTEQYNDSRYLLSVSDYWWGYRQLFSEGGHEKSVMSSVTYNEKWKMKNEKWKRRVLIFSCDRA